MLSAAWLLTCALALQAPEQGGTVPEPAAARPPAPSADVAPETPLHDLARGFLRDFKQLPSRQNLVIAGIGTAATLVTHAADSKLNQWIADQNSASYPSIGGTFGYGLVQAGTAIGVFAIGVAAEHEKTERIGQQLIRAQVLNAVLTGTVKLASQRTRPSGGDHSMPSGHTSAAIATAVVVHEHLGWKVGIPAYAAAGFVGWSRLRGEHHWLSDVTMGVTVGLIAGRTVTTDERRQWTVIPAVAPDRAALYVLWTP